MNINLQDNNNVSVFKNRYREGGSWRQWCRKTSNSLLPMDTPNLELYMEQFPLKDIEN